MPTALIIEDEPEANKLLALLVQLRNYRTDSALTGREGLSCIRRNRPDVIFLDLMLPDTDGFEICETIKSQPETCQIPVIIVSARLAEESRARSFREGALAFVSKPYTPEQIFQALASAEDWNGQLQHRGDVGEIRFGVDDESFARAVARLRCQLRARTPMDESSAAQVLTALQAIQEETRSQSRDAGPDLDPVLLSTYTLGEDRLTLVLREEPHRPLDGQDRPLGARLPPRFQRVFDEIHPSESGRSIRLIRSYTSRTPDGTSP